MTSNTAQNEYTYNNIYDTYYSYKSPEENKNKNKEAQPFKIIYDRPPKRFY